MTTDDLYERLTLIEPNRPRWPNRTIVFVDPGETGGGLAVLGLDRRIRWVVDWKKTRRGRMPFDVHSGDPRTKEASTPFAEDKSTMRYERAETLADVLLKGCGREALGSTISPIWCVERMENHGAKRGIVTLFEAAGVAKCVGYLNGATVVEKDGRPSCNRWRPDMLGVVGNDSRAEEVAVRAVLGVKKPMPGSRRIVDFGLEPMQPSAISGHVAEAICGAYWTAGWHVGKVGS